MTADVRSAARRGRPQRISDGHTSLDAQSCVFATSWLLRACRLRCGQEDFAKITNFVSAFRGGSWDAGIDQSKVSRWETGLLKVPFRAARRYEELLNLPQYSLTTIINTLRRYFAPKVNSPSALARATFDLDEDHGYNDYLGTVLDKIRFGDSVSGEEWDNLTSFLSAVPTRSPLPLATWGSVSQRLLTEMIISDGLPWMQRYESFCRLLSHPVAQRAAIGACASLGADTTNQVFIETLCALDRSAHQDANDVIFCQLENPTNDRSFHGALLACVQKSQFGHFSGDEARRLADMVHSIALNTSAHDDNRERLAVVVLRKLLTNRRYARPLADLRLDRLRNVVHHGQVADTQVMHVVTGRVHAGVLGNLPHIERDTLDEFLPVLIREMLFSPASDVRLYAAMLLRASPYRDALAKALVQDLGRSATLRDPYLAQVIVEALRVVGGRDQASYLQNVLVAQGIGNDLRTATAFAVGHMDPDLADPFWTETILRHSERWADDHDPGSSSLLTGLTYSLGIAGDALVLSQIVDRDVPPAVRNSARWWVNIPKSVRDGART